MLYGLLCHDEAQAAENMQKIEEDRVAKEAEEAEEAEEAKKAEEGTKVRTYWRTWWFHSKYDPAIKAYLNGMPPGETESRRETLLKPWREEADEMEKNWKKKNNAKEDPSRPNAAILREEPFLFTSNTDPRKLAIDDLTNRTNKLADLPALVSRMNRDLSRLTEDLAMGVRCH
jgi:hypothetical protein